MDIEKVANTNVMGFPLWLVGILGIGAYLIVRHLSSGSSQPALISTGSSGAGSAPSGAGSVPITTGSTQTATSNLENWLSNAQNALQSLGYDTNTSNSALQNYIAGNSLSKAGYSIVQAALKLVGNAPGLGSPQLNLQHKTVSNNGNPSTVTGSTGGAISAPSTPTSTLTASSIIHWALSAGLNSQQASSIAQQSLQPDQANQLAGTPPQVIAQQLISSTSRDFAIQNYIKQQEASGQNPQQATQSAATKFG